MSRNRTCVRLMKYSLSPARYARRVISTSANSIGSLRSALSKTHRDFGQAERLARLVAGEDHVFEFAATRRLLARRFAQHPAKRVDEIRFARAVRPDDRRDAAAELERRRLGERLESERFDAS